jgi:predicted GNAT family acetyltransferase
MARYELINNEEENRYEFQIDDQIAFIDYRKDEHRRRIDLVHTKVPKPLQNQGIGTELVKQTLTHIRAQNYELIPHCPFIATYVQEHTGWADLIPEDRDTV